MIFLNELEKYYQWLIKNFCKHNDNYGFLLRRLWDKEFYSLVKNDENRIADGLYLRYEYCMDKKIEALDKLSSTGCRVLEVLIALSLKGISSISEKKTHILSSDFFWIMIKNLGLEDFNDEYVIKFGEPLNEIEFILNRFLDRKYDFDGKNGGLFPLNLHTNFDIRKKEIWEQMNLFIIQEKMF